MLNMLVGQNIAALVEHICDSTSIVSALCDQLDNKEWLTLDFIADSLRAVRYQNVGVQPFEKEKLYSNSFSSNANLQFIIPFPEARGVFNNDIIEIKSSYSCQSIFKRPLKNIFC